MTLRAAVVGCGALANGAHLPTLQKSELFDLIVTCDKVADAAESAARRWGAARACTNWHDVTAAPDVDMISGRLQPHIRKLLTPTSRMSNWPSLCSHVAFRQRIMLSRYNMQKIGQRAWMS